MCIAKAIYSVVVKEHQNGCVFISSGEAIPPEGVPSGIHVPSRLLHKWKNSSYTKDLDALQVIQRIPRKAIVSNF